MTYDSVKAAEYRKLHHESELKKQATFRAKHYDKIHAKTNCGCGGKYVYMHKATHARTKKHQKWLASA